MIKHFVRFTSFLTLLLVLQTYSVHAQEWQFGVHVDPAVNWFFSDSHYVSNAGAQFGFRGGVEVSRNFIERVGILFGASYDLRMADLLYADTSLMVNPKYESPKMMARGSILSTRAQYFYVPFGVKMQAIEIGYWTITAAVGISCSVLFSQRIESKEMGLNRQASKDFFTWGYPGYFFRLGTEYSLGGRSSVDMGIAYHGTFTPVAKPGIGNLYYHNVSFRVGFLF